VGWVKGENRFGGGGKHRDGSAEQKPGIPREKKTSHQEKKEGGEGYCRKLIRDIEAKTRSSQRKIFKHTIGGKDLSRRKVGRSRLLPTEDQQG